MTNCKCTFRQYMVGDGCDICNPKKALEYAYETIEDQRSEIAELESKLDNITCIVAEAKTHLSEVKLSSVSVAVVSALLADLAYALKADGNK